VFQVKNVSFKDNDWKITRTPSENMLALKLLTEKLTRDEFEDYKNIIRN
jgi:predicted secreted protein